MGDLIPDLRRRRVVTALLSLALVLAGVGGAPTVPAHAATELYFSEYTEGSGFNKAVEIYNGTGAPVDLAAGGYTLELYSNGSPTASQTVALTGTIASGDVFVVSRADADPLLVAQADQLAPAVVNWNGDDAVVLRKGGAIVDVIGQIGVDPGTEWGSGLTSTADNTLRRKSTVTAGDANGSDPFDPSVQWDGFANNTLDGFGFYPDPSGPPPAAARIYEIQGRSHTSPRAGQAVANVPGVVTAVRSNGFYLQDATGDGDPATSDAIFVFTSSAPAVAVGQSVIVAGTVAEFRPGGPSTANLTTTEITSPTISAAPTSDPMPAPVVIGTTRTPPTEVIDNDANGSVETGGTFDPATDGIDFWESLEAMRVRVDDAVVVGPTNGFGEIWVLANNGAGAGLRTPRGGIVIRPGDFNPERIQIDDTVAIAGNPAWTSPAANVGDHFAASIVGVIDYDFGNFELLNTSQLTVVPGGVQRETTALAPGGERVTIGSFNVENLDPSDPPAKFAALASVIVNHLRSPDILGLEEVQDNNGATNDGVVDANVTYAALIAAIQAAGGPAYQVRQVNPIDDAEGGEPGGNIRVAFLFNPARVEIEDRVGPGGVPTGTTTVLSPGNSGKAQLDSNPGRLQDPNPASAVYQDGTPNAFQSSRRPLVAEFKFRGRRLFIVNNHFSSKGGDQPLFGRFQPPQLTSENQRREQARIVRDFVTKILEKEPDANVVVLGDLNDFHFSRPLEILESLEGTLPASHQLHNLVETLPEGERYTYVFEGNSQALDGGILVSGNLFQNASVEYDVVHVNAEFHDQISDHEPQVVRFLIPNPAQATTAGP